MRPTEDPHVFIEAQTENEIIYRCGDQRWVIVGRCSCCGQCEAGAAHADYQVWTGIPVGQPGACLDKRYGQRQDVPVRPELTRKMSACSLQGWYL